MGDTLPEVTVGEVLRTRGIAGLFVVHSGDAGLGRPVRKPACQRLGVALTGYTDHVDPERIQIAGNAESGYLGTLSPGHRHELLARLLETGFAAVVVTSGHAPPPELRPLCDAHRVALVTTALSSAEAVARLDELLHRRLAPRETRHGTLVDVYGIGVLLLGKSGIGKSEVALELVESGHRLVADDAVVLAREAPDMLIGSGEELARHHIDIRGLGILNVRDLFGAAAVRERKRVELVAELAEWSAGDEGFDLLGIDDRRIELVGVPLAHVRIPVRPGRSLKVIIEVAARNLLLMSQGTHAARAFSERLNQRLTRARPMLDATAGTPATPEADRE